MTFILIKNLEQPRGCSKFSLVYIELLLFHSSLSGSKTCDGHAEG